MLDVPVGLFLFVKTLWAETFYRREDLLGTTGHNTKVLVIMEGGDSQVQRKFSKGQQFQCIASAGPQCVPTRIAKLLSHHPSSCHAVHIPG